jgi:hypothetical protein
MTLNAHTAPAKEILLNKAETFFGSVYFFGGKIETK